MNNTSTMHTANFGRLSSHNKDQSTKLFFNNNQNNSNTYQTEHANHSSIYGPNREDMNLSELQLTKSADESILVDGNHRIPAHRIDGSYSKEKTYNCSICDRLRAICPYKNYITYKYCRNCKDALPNKTAVEANQHHHQQTTTKSSHFNHSKPAKSKSHIFQQTRPASFSKYNNQNSARETGVRPTVNQNPFALNIPNTGLKLEQVNKVRFLQSKNEYPLKTSSSNRIYRPPSPQNFSRPKPSSTNNLNYGKNKIRQIIDSQPHTLTEQIIFYPVIHNQIVFKNSRKRNGGSLSSYPYGNQNQPTHHTYNPEERNSQSRGQQSTQNIGRKRFANSHYGKTGKQITRQISEFLSGPYADDVITPTQFNRLAGSMRREGRRDVYD